jgi:ATP-dependent Clp protease adaptor protein ClpS
MIEKATFAAELVTTTRPAKRHRGDQRPKRQPRYHVVLWDDDDHTHAYVMVMLQRLFGFPLEKGYQVADEVDHRGKAIVMTTTKEHAELKRDQIHAFGKDILVSESKGSMSASIEPEIG